MLLRRAGADEVDVLKMDIEGSEGEVFSGDVHSWLPRVRTVLMEIHDRQSEEIVLRALANYDCAIQTSCELWIFRNIKPKPLQALDQALNA
jgi:hypothetical protein